MIFYECPGCGHGNREGGDCPMCGARMKAADDEQFDHHPDPEPEYDGLDFDDGYYGED